jgi:hypothetical protein
VGFGGSKAAVIRTTKQAADIAAAADLAQKLSASGRWLGA